MTIFLPDFVVFCPLMKKILKNFRHSAIIKVQLNTTNLIGGYKFGTNNTAESGAGGKVLYRSENETAG